MLDRVKHGATRLQVVEEADRVLSWLQQKQQLQAQAKPYEDPVLLSSDIKKKEDTLRRVAGPILTKPPPAPKVPPLHHPGVWHVKLKMRGKRGCRRDNSFSIQENDYITHI